MGVKPLMEFDIKIKEREFRAGLRAAQEFNKDEVLIIGDIEGVEQKHGITFRLIPLRHWLQ